MNWQQVEGTWTELKGKAKEQWGKFTEDDLKIIAGKRDKLVGQLQKTYGYAKERAEKEADEFASSCRDSSRKMGGSC